VPVETPSIFAKVIQDHLELKQRNSRLDRQMPIERYRAEDPFENHPLFKTEEQARLEETMDGVQPEIVAHVSASAASWPGEETAEHPAPPELEESGLWTRSRDFDWGD
jgi:hypothetical protein